MNLTKSERLELDVYKAHIEAKKALSLHQFKRYVLLSKKDRGILSKDVHQEYAENQ